MSAVFIARHFNYNKIIMPVLLYSCETWPLTLRDKRRLSIFGNRIIRRVLEPKRNENGESRMFDNEELQSLYHSPNMFMVIKSSMSRWTTHVNLKLVRML